MDIKTKPQMKATIYESLHSFNRNCVEIEGLLRFFRSRGLVPQEETAYYRDMIEEVRALVSQRMAESLEQVEGARAAVAGRKRLKGERKLFERAT